MLESTPTIPKEQKFMGKRTKIVGTLGPSSSDYETQKKLVESGLNIARLNFSHGDHATHLKNINSIRKIAEEFKKPVAILQDLQGPKIRVGKLLNDKMTVESGATYLLKYGEVQTVANIIPIDYRGLVHDVKVGQRVMMDDGLLILEVEAIEDETVHVKVLEGGLLKNRKGVNFPDSKLSMPAMTDKDSKDLLFGIANRVDFVALSFVQDPADIIQIKGMIAALGSDVPVIAKIEKLPAIDRIDEIAQVADGLMVARGDLGVEANVERVPRLQQIIIEAARKHSKPVIIATQMLESMITNPRASQAEVTDVANGVLDGADALMLSGEVASGRYPVETVARMASIINTVEDWTLSGKFNYKLIVDPEASSDWQTNESVAISACETADIIGAKAVVCLSLTGSIAREISKWRPKVPVIAFTPRQDIVNRLNLVWGVRGIINPTFFNTDELLAEVPSKLKEIGIVNSGDKVVITAGIPVNKMKPTNMVQVTLIP